MTAFAGAYVLRDASVTIDDVEYANQLYKARLVPDTPIQTQRTLVPDGVVTDVDSTVWTFEIEGLQGWKSGGLAAALNAAAGTQIEVILVPKNGTGEKNATFTIIAMPLPFGGDQGSFVVGAVTFPVVGAPVFGTET